MSLLTNPKKFKIANLVLVGFWLVLIPISYVMGWLSSTTYISALSLYAIVIAHLSTYAAARTEEMQTEADKRLAEDHERLQKLDPDHPEQTVDGQPDN